MMNWWLIMELFGCDFTPDMWTTMYLIAQSEVKLMRVMTFVLIGLSSQHCRMSLSDLK